MINYYISSYKALRVRKRPLLTIPLNIVVGDRVGLKLDYGDDIPLAGENYFTVNCNIIEIKVNVTVDVHHSTN